MFIEGEDSIKKEGIKHFPTEDFSWIDDIFPEEEEDEQKEGDIEDNPLNRVSYENVIDIDENLTEAQQEVTKDIPPVM